MAVIDNDGFIFAGLEKRDDDVRADVAETSGHNDLLSASNVRQVHRVRTLCFEVDDTAMGMAEGAGVAK